MMFEREVNWINGCIGKFGFMHHGFGMVLILIIVLILSIAIIILLNKRKKSHVANAVLEALKLRYVKGEISEEEYIKMKKLIEV